MAHTMRVTPGSPCTTGESMMQERSDRRACHSLCEASPDWSFVGYS